MSCCGGASAQLHETTSAFLDHDFTDNSFFNSIARSTDNSTEGMRYSIKGNEAKFLYAGERRPSYFKLQFFGQEIPVSSAYRWCAERYSIGVDIPVYVFTKKPDKRAISCVLRSVLSEASHISKERVQFFAAPWGIVVGSVTSTGIRPMSGIMIYDYRNFIDELGAEVVGLRIGSDGLKKGNLHLNIKVPPDEYSTAGGVDYASEYQKRVNEMYVNAFSLMAMNLRLDECLSRLYNLRASTYALLMRAAVTGDLPITPMQIDYKKYIFEGANFSDIEDVIRFYTLEKALIPNAIELSAIARRLIVNLHDGRDLTPTERDSNVSIALMHLLSSDEFAQTRAVMQTRDWRCLGKRR
jgi:hypothetical protein